MKKIIFLAIVTFQTLLALGQDLNINHYPFYRDGLNPGSFIQAPEVNVFVLYNNEFWGFREEPNTQILDVSVNLDGNKLGIMVYNDIIGWDKAQNIKLRYARLFQISDKTSFSLGLSPGIIHKRLMATQMSFEQSGIVDPVSLYDQTHTVFDFDFGGEIRFNNLIFGLSANHLGKPLSDFSSVNPTPHYYAYTQYTTSGTNVQFRPNVLFRYWKNTYWVEAGALAFFNNLFWFGATYTNDHDLTCMAGLKILKSKNIHFGYAFKSNMNDQILRPGSTNSHEIFLNFGFGEGSSQFPNSVRNMFSN
jgi:type IX secretion system PorP/SprF family membrane protein